MAKTSNDKILKLLEDKILLKKDVFEKTNSVFIEIKKLLLQIVLELKSKVKSIDKNSLVEYIDKSSNEVQITLADETLIFVLHSNIFTFDHNHEIWKSSYIEKDPSLSYCGQIFIYNFLSDSLRYNRSNDVGYLIARIFINKEGYYFVEGKKQLGYLYSDFSTSILDNENLSRVVQTAILYSLDFDPFTPPFEAQTQISVREVIEASLQARIATGKRLGFEFSNDDKPISG
jgi:hypothetical protein